MKNSKSALAIIGFTVATVFTAPAVAQDAGFYVGGSIGRSDVKDFD